MSAGERRTLRPDAEVEGTVELDPLRAASPVVRAFTLSVAEGEARGLSWKSSSERCSIGSHPSNDFVLSDPTVSRFHCEITVAGRGARVRDLGSLNGTFVDGTQVVEAHLKNGSAIRLGRSVLSFNLGEKESTIAQSAKDSFGGLLGGSVAMRAAFAILEKVAVSDATVLIEGETGTGKDVAAEGIHQASPRRDANLVVVDCGAVPANLLESQLFGHERGAFTGADQRRVGAFEEASGGTVFLDEIGELPLELQPKLLRVLEKKQITRLGSNQPRPVDVRIVAATNRDLRAMVNSGQFREDLYYRLAVVRVRLPALRERPEDIPGLVRRFVQTFGANAAAVERLTRAEHLSALARSAWPGNVRELKNAVERSVVLDQPGLPPEPSLPVSGAVDIGMPYEEARHRALGDFERRYLTAQLAAHGDNVSAAARASGMGRVHFHRLLRRSGLR
ncbi:MAG: sigma 54-interacting transcriptional regulator [Myxococcales bacterium]|nr:sigma 54-interacting transcriptional regulator [Myxococcales bacterium]